GVGNGQVDDAGFGRAVRKHKGRTMHARGRGDIDDRAGALLPDELAGRRLRAEEHAVEIDSDHRAPSVGREIQRRRRDTGAVIVNQHVEAAELLDRLRHHLVALLGVADVDLSHLAFTACFANFVAHALEVFELAARDQHRRAAQRELLGDRLANSGSATGHDRNLAFDTEWILQNGNFLPGWFAEIYRTVATRWREAQTRSPERQAETGGRRNLIVCETRGGFAGVTPAPDVKVSMRASRQLNWGEVRLRWRADGPARSAMGPAGGAD